MPLALMGLLLSASFDPTVLTVDLTTVQEPHASTTKEIAEYYANIHDLKKDRFLAVINCESGWNPKAVGDYGTSFGLAQLHRPERDWGITREEAQVPEIALEIMAKAWVKGEAYRWTCWRNLYGSTAS